MIEIEKNRKGTKCMLCRKHINTKYRVFYNTNFYHLSCFFNWNDKTLLQFKEHRKKLIRYKNWMVIEKLSQEIK